MLDMSVSIMAHPSREEYVEELVRDLDMPHRIVWDEKDEEWDTGRRAWRVGLSEGADYHLVIQDDAILCRDFAERSAAAINWANGQPVSFYIGAGRPYGNIIGPSVHRAMKTGRRWMTARGPLWGVAVAIPTDEIEAMLRACERSTLVYDERIQDYFHKHGTDCWYTIPSLVNHRQLPSLVEGHDFENVRRVAVHWEENPGDLLWDTMPLAIGDPNQPFRADGSKLICSACEYEALLVPEMAEHVHEDHGSLDRLDYFAMDAESAEIFAIFFHNTAKSIRGQFWVMGRELHELAGPSSQWTTPATAARTLKLGGEWPVVVSSSAAFPFIGARPVVSMDGQECPTDLIVDHPGVKVHA